MITPARINRRYRIFISGTSDGLTDHLPHGDGLVAVALIRELARRGHDIDIAGTDIALQNALPANVRFHFLPVAATDSFAERMRYAVLVRRLYDRLSRLTPFDVVHQFNPVVAGLSLGFTAFSAPLVLGAYIQNWAEPLGGRHGTRLRATLETLGRDVIASLQQLAAAKIIVTTESARDRVPLAPLLRRKIAVIPHGIDVAKLPQYESNAVADDAAPTILFLANLVRRKGIFTLLDAFDRVASRIDNVRLLVGGSGREADAVRQRIDASPYTARIELLGNVAREDLARTLRRASVYCLPSHGEPFGMTALEAMVCGVPVVVTREGGLGEIVPDYAGQKVPSDDSTALASALESLVVAGGAARVRIGARNRAYVERTFALPAVADRLETLYASVVRSHIIVQPRAA